jgi:hypothetical protein
MTSPDGITWTTRTSAANNEWYSVCWSPELGLFVAVAITGTGNRVMTSPDGITWTTRTSAVNNQWRSVCWSPELGLFVAVATSGTGNRVMTSPDGITWTARTSPADNEWFSVCWSPELGLFVAVAASGTGNRVMTSPDGITWTIRTSAADNQWLSVCWSAKQGIFVCVAATGTSNRVSTSRDVGIKQPPILDSKYLTSLDIGNNTGFLNRSTGAYANVAVRGKGILHKGLASTDPLSSRAVNSWTARTTPADHWWNSVCWSPELGIFVAVSETGAGNRVMTSPDGITWTIRTSAADNGWFGVCWSSERGLFVAVAGSGTGNRVMTSPDGITWTTRTSAADNDWSSVCWSPELGIFVAVSETGTNNRVMTSPDGITWTTRTSAANNQWRSVCWSPELGLFVAVAASGTGNRVMTSPDGITWTTRTSAANNFWISVCWSPELGIFAAVSTTGSGNRVMTSRDVGNRTPTIIDPNKQRFLSFDSCLIGASSTPSNTVTGSAFIRESSGRRTLYTSSSTTASIELVNFINTNGTVGTITTSGTSTSYNTTSDYRLKENEVEIVNASEQIKLLKPYRFNFKSDPNTIVEGFFAHEVQAVVPGAVTGNKDQVIEYGSLSEFVEEIVENEIDGEVVETSVSVKKLIQTNVINPGDLPENFVWEKTHEVPVYQSIDHSKLIPLLTAALKEALSKIEELEERINTLENSGN